MALLSPEEEDLPPLDWEGFQAWLIRQKEKQEALKQEVAAATTPPIPPTIMPDLPPPSAPTVPFTQKPDPREEELKQTLAAMELTKQSPFLYPREEKEDLPPLSQEEITSGRAFKVPDEGMFAPMQRVLGAVKKGALEGMRTEEHVGPPEEEVQRIQNLGPFTEGVQDIARGTGVVADVAGRTMHTLFGGAVEGFHQSLLEGGASETTARQVTGDLVLETMRRGGEFNPGSVVKARPFSAAKYLATRPEEATLHRFVKPRVSKWIEESPNARDITPEPVETVLGSLFSKTGKPKIAETVTERPGDFYNKLVEEDFKVGPDELKVRYHMANAPKGGVISQISFEVLEADKRKFAYREAGVEARSPELGRDTLFTVVSSIENHIRKVRPERVEFVAASDRLIPLYDRFARQLAQEHDGVIRAADDGIYEIDFPRHAPTETTLGSGLVGLTTLLTGTGVLAAAPYILNKVWRARPLGAGGVIHPEFGPTNLRLYDRASDIRRAYHVSPWSGLFANLRRQGYDNKAHFDALEQNSNSALFSKIDDALESGEMPGLDATYKIKVPHGQNRPVSVGRIYAGAKALPKEQRAIAGEYLLLGDVLDRMASKKATSGAGMTDKQIRQRMSDIEKVFPEIKLIQRDFESAMMAVIEYQGSGKFSTIGPKKVREITTNHRRLVPWEMDLVDQSKGLYSRLTERALAWGSKDPDLFTRTLLERKLSLSSLPRVDPFDMLVRATQMGLRDRTLNAVSGGIRDAFASTGKHGIVEITKADMKEHPKWAERMFIVKESGVSHRYVSSSFIADVARFDPHFTMNSVLWAGNRAFQWGTTRYGAPWFALVQFFRENQLANLNKPSGFKGIGVPYINSTIGAGSLFWNSQRKLFSDAIYRNLDSGAGRVMRAYYSPAAAMKGVSVETVMRLKAEKMAQRYMDSMVHLYHQRGGAGATMTQAQVQYAKSAIDEALRNVNAPHWAKLLGNSYKNAIDAMHSAGKYTFWARNVKRAKSRGSLTEELMDTITRESRHLTSDLSQSGRYFPGAARDITDKNLFNAIELTVGGRGAQILRENTIWFNAMIKGYERLNRAYWENPLKFIGKIHVGVSMPTALSFFGSMLLGKEYLDYMLNQRSEYDKLTKLYIPIWGRPPEEGLWLPWGLEFAPYQYVLLGALGDEFAGAESEADAMTQAWTILTNSFGINLPPTLVAGATLLTGAKVPTTVPGVFGEDAYVPKEKSESFLPGNLELGLRAQFGGVMDPFLGMLNTLSSEHDVMGAIGEAAYRSKQKFPIVGGGQLSSMNKVGQDYYEFTEKLTRWEELYRKYYAHPGVISDPYTKGKKPKPVDDDIVTYGPGDKLIPDMVHGRTKKGRVSKRMVPGGDKEILMPGMAVQRLDENVSTMDKPTNPVFEGLVKGLHNHFESKSQNWGKLMKRQNIISEHIRTLKNKNASNVEGTRAYIEKIPDGDPMKAELMQFDWSKRDSVRKGINYLEKERMKGFRFSKLFVKELEQRIELQTGKKVDLDKLDPYIPGSGLVED